MSQTPPLNDNQRAWVIATMLECEPVYSGGDILETLYSWTSLGSNKSYGMFNPNTPDITHKLMVKFKMNIDQHEDSVGAPSDLISAYMPYEEKNGTGKDLITAVQNCAILMFDGEIPEELK